MHDTPVIECQVLKKGGTAWGCDPAGYRPGGVGLIDHLYEKNIFAFFYQWGYNNYSKKWRALL